MEADGEDGNHENEDDDDDCDDDDNDILRSAESIGGFHKNMSLISF